MSDSGSSRFQWPYSAAPTFVGLMWIVYGWSIWAAQGIDQTAMGFEAGSLTGEGDYIAGSLFWPAVFAFHEWERLVSCIFLHGGFLHIIFNSAAILQMGRILEMFTTRGRCWFTLLFSGLCGSLVTLVWGRITNDPMNAIGASGAGCGIGAALIVLSRGIPGLAEFRKQMITWTVVMLLIGLMPRISGAGHLGGAIGGALSALVIGRRGSLRMVNDRYSKLIDVLTVVLTLTFAAALVINAIHVPERRLEISNETELDQAGEDVQRWTSEGLPPDVDAWVRRIEGMELTGGMAEERDDLVRRVRSMQATASRPTDSR